MSFVSVIVTLMTFCIVTSYGASPVPVEVYFESYCPYSIDFVNNKLMTSWEKYGDDVMSVELFPYGNANKSRDDNGQYVFNCQHGPKECQVNIVENCVIDVSVRNAKIFLPIIDCIMKDRREKEPDEDIQKCVEAGNMNYADVQSCANGNHGNELFWECGDVTEKLWPPKQYVPWVLVNDVLYDEDEDFEKTLINAYEEINGEKPAGGNASKNSPTFINIVLILFAFFLF